MLRISHTHTCRFVQITRIQYRFWDLGAIRPYSIFYGFVSNLRKNHKANLNKNLADFIWCMPKYISWHDKNSNMVRIEML